MLRRTGVLVIALAIVTTGCAGGDDGRQLNTVAQKRTTTSLTTTTTTITTTTAAPVAVTSPRAARIQRVRSLPAAERPTRAPKAPAARRGPTPTGRIEIPRIGLNHLTYEGIELSVIDHGPSHWPGTALPGQNGNTVFPGHRVTHSRPFYNIDLIQIGDPVTFVNSSGRYTYEVTEKFVVNEDETWIAEDTALPTMTIFACHPKHSARQRYVAKGKLVKSERVTNSNEPAAATNGNGADGQYPTADDPGAPPAPETTTTTQRRGIGGILG